mgnify:FL=1|tara:strand:- start:452 stop:673 length:222 start_codon:yes stop_codon:yes gene_type:complete
MKKLLLVLLLCSGCYGTYYTTDVKRVYYSKPVYYKPYVYKPTTTVVIKPNKIYGPKKPNKTYKPYKKPHYKKK